MLIGSSGAAAPWASGAGGAGQRRDDPQVGIVLLGSFAAAGDATAVAGLERALGIPVQTLGALNAGPDYYLARPGDLGLIARARAAVVQLVGADRLSNPFYTVHPRRNDRFLAATPALTRLFPMVDLTEIHFTRHLLMVLEASDPDRFATVRAALQTTWTARMRQLFGYLPAVRVLLALPEGAGQTGPNLVTRGMLDDVAPEVSVVITGQPGEAPVPDLIARALS